MKEFSITNRTATGQMPAQYFANVIGRIAIRAVQQDRQNSPDDLNNPSIHE